MEQAIADHRHHHRGPDGRDNPRREVIQTKSQFEGQIPEIVCSGRKKVHRQGGMNN
jgi:hypothetical protein